MDIYYNLNKDFEILPRLAVRTYVSPRGKVTHILIGIFKWNMEFIIIKKYKF